MKFWKISAAGLGLLTVGLCLSTVTQKAHADGKNSDDNVELLTGNDKFGTVVSKDGQASSVIVNKSDLLKVIDAVGDPSQVADNITATSSLAGAKTNAKNQFNAYANKFKNYVKGQKLSASDTKTLDDEIDRIVSVTDSQIDSANSMDEINTVIENGLYGSSIVSAGKGVKQNTNLDDTKDKLNNGSKVGDNQQNQNATSQIKSDLGNQNNQKAGSNGDDDDKTPADKASSNSSSATSSSNSSSQEDKESTKTNNNNGNSNGGGNNTGTSNSGNSTSNINTQRGLNNQDSSNVDKNAGFSSVQEMEKYAQDHGDASVIGRTVKTNVNEIITNSNKGHKGDYKTDFYGDQGVDFYSTNYFDVSAGDEVTVTIVSYTEGDDDEAGMVDFSNLTKPGQGQNNANGSNGGGSTQNGSNNGGSQSGQNGSNGAGQNGSGNGNSAGQNGNGSANSNGDSNGQSSLPQTGMSMTNNALTTVGGLLSMFAILAGGTVLRKREN